MKPGQLILHIGNCKTGTTALQHFFENNRDAMAKAGLYYPRSGNGYFSYNHWALMYEYIADFSRVWPIPADYQRHPDGFSGLVKDLAREIEPRLAAGDDVLLSCEGFFFDNRSRTDVSRLLKVFASWNPRAVLYLRRQDAMLDSMINELVKDGDIVHTRDSAEGFAKHLIIPYHDRLDWWAGVLGRDRITVRPYEKSAYSAEHTLFRDFFAAIGHDYRDDYREPTDEANTSIRTMPGFLVMNTINRTRASPQQKFRFAPLVQAWEKTHDFPRYTILDQPLHDFVCTHSLGQNTAIAREYLLREDGVLFVDTPPPPIAPPPPDLKPDPVHLADFHGYLVRHQPSALRWLSSLIAGTPDYEAYGEHLGPLRILCHAEVSGDATDDQSPISGDDEVEQLRRQLQQTEGELVQAFFLLDQYKRTLQSHPPPPPPPPPPAPDFLNSRLYRYVARPTWAVTGALRQVPGFAAARQILRPVMQSAARGIRRISGPRD